MIIQTNPLLTIHFRAHPTDGKQAIGIVPSPRRSFDLSDGVLSILAFGKEPHSFPDFVTFYAQLAELGPEHAELLIHQLVGSELLISGTPDNYDLWIDRGWRVALNFHLLTRDLPFVDMGQADEADIKRALLESYLQENSPTFFKHYQDSQLLPTPVFRHKSLGEVLRTRRTRRTFAGAPIELSELSNILCSACQPAAEIRNECIRHWRENPLSFLRSQWTPFEIYFINGTVQDLSMGVYHYDLQAHEVALIQKGDFLERAKAIAIGQGVNGCSVIFLISSCFERYMWRYRTSRALRNLYVDAGSLAHRLILAAVAADFDTFLTPAIRDSNANALLQLDGHSESVIYLVGIGK